ncbi:hypothetical protein AWM75_01480 [Aerococcus urinaehominis]|uniref:Uncharacterized protein n=1 Tax=Aerococcus urinaehominis TaxID=128944 RepID=A0A0X8FK18_9LACT|nr:GNAT family N-acetyltransferase [Aerococcus urinaehominis]AMB98746.1 hypothetical protein AWM75_01480 [Aerococcus urinaehominis]SDM14328.1 Acetyltransferase (GNAT) domain-containing protein [Aerococcus urinaehominis]
MSDLTHRFAETSDYPAIAAIFNQASQFLADQGVDQWQNRPSLLTSLAQVLETETGHVWLLDDQVQAFCVLAPGDKGYDQYDDWQVSGPYYAVHRLMVADDLRGQGASQQIFQDITNLAKEKGMASLRIDTHPDNLTMQHIIKKQAFNYVTSISITEDNYPRYAYEKAIN